MDKKHYIRQRKGWTRSIIYDRGKGGQEALYTTKDGQESFTLPQIKKL